jgi:ketosteroid isomerase-like protein
MYVPYSAPLADVNRIPCVQASSSGTTTSGLPYRNEYAFTLRVATSSSGEAKITSIEEFCDSATLGAFFSQMASASTS